MGMVIKFSFCFVGCVGCLFRRMGNEVRKFCCRVIDF